MYTNIDPNHFYARKLFLERNTFSLNKAMVIILDGTYAHVAIVWKGHIWKSEWKFVTADM